MTATSGLEDTPAVVGERTVRASGLAERCPLKTAELERLPTIFQAVYVRCNWSVLAFGLLFRERSKTSTDLPIPTRLVARSIRLTTSACDVRLPSRFRRLFYR